MEIEGEDVGEVRLNFETNGDGVAFKIKNREEVTTVKGGERNDVTIESGLKIKFKVPADEELIGFHGKQDENHKITQLGIITRNTNCSSGDAPSTTGGQPPADPTSWNSGFDEKEAVDLLVDNVSNIIGQ